MIFVYLLLLFTYGHKIHCLNLFPEFENIALEVKSKTNWWDELYTPRELFETRSIAALTDVSYEYLSNSIHYICVTEFLLKQKAMPRFVPIKMRIELFTKCSSISYCILRMDLLAKDYNFNAKQKVVVLVSGWKNPIGRKSFIEGVVKAYQCRGNVNLVALDIATFLNSLTTWASLDTEEVGRQLADALVQLSDFVSYEKFHLIGHSLGAHIVGAAARYFTQKTNKTIPRVTGLDPSKPCAFDGVELPGLQIGDAKFIDVIHSSPGLLGVRDAVGDVDFYPNELDELPPGCCGIFCAHNRAWKYYAETVYLGNERGFLAKHCNSMERLRNKECKGADIAMGYSASEGPRGSHFLEVNSVEPFGMSSKDSVVEDFKMCGYCDCEDHYFK